MDGLLLDSSTPKRHLKSGRSRGAEVAISTSVPSTLVNFNDLRQHVVDFRKAREKLGGRENSRNPREHWNGVVAKISSVRQGVQIYALHDQANQGHSRHTQ